jgi:hypothetical protein
LKNYFIDNRKIKKFWRKKKGRWDSLEAYVVTEEIRCLLALIVSEGSMEKMIEMIGKSVFELYGVKIEKRKERWINK